MVRRKGFRDAAQCRSSKEAKTSENKIFYVPTAGKVSPKA